GLFGRRARSAGPEPDVLGDREVVVQEGGVGEQTDAPPDGPPVTREVVPEHDRLPGDYWNKSRADAQQGGLAGTVGALEEDDLAPRNVEVGAGEGREPSEQGNRGAEVDDRVHVDGDEAT